MSSCLTDSEGLRIWRLAMKASSQILVAGALWTIAIANAPISQAQTTRGTIAGVVTDESGAVVAGVSVRCTEIDTGAGHTATTDTQGNYVLPSLLPGRYRVEATSKAFEKTVIEPLQLHVNERMSVDLAMKVGPVTQEVKVISQGELVETGSASIGQVV